MSHFTSTSSSVTGGASVVVPSAISTSPFSPTAPLAPVRSFSTNLSNINDSNTSSTSCERISIKISARKLPVMNPSTGSSDTFAVLSSVDVDSNRNRSNSNSSGSSSNSISPRAKKNGGGGDDINSKSNNNNNNNNSVIKEFLGSSNICRDSLQPVFSTVFMADYHFELAQEFQVQLYQYNHEGGSSTATTTAHNTLASLSKHTPIGSVRFSLTMLMRAQSQKLTFAIKDGKGAGKITIRGESLAYVRDNFSVQFSCFKLSNKTGGFFTAPSPQLFIYRKNCSLAADNGEARDDDDENDIHDSSSSSAAAAAAAATAVVSSNNGSGTGRSSISSGITTKCTDTKSSRSIDWRDRYRLVWQNAPVANTLNPSWDTVKIPMAVLCDADIDRPLRIEIRDSAVTGAKKKKKKDGGFSGGGFDESLMGCVETTVREMCERSNVVDSGNAVTSSSNSNNNHHHHHRSNSYSDDGSIENNTRARALPFDVIKESKKAKYAATPEKYVNSGTFVAGGATIDRNPLFSDYIIGGTEISLVVGIDFTASNVDATLPSSLHYIDPLGKKKNPYESAILHVGEVLQEYDSDQKYPVFGFGAKVRTADGTWSAAQHCFPVCDGGVEVDGIDGILNAYKNVISNISLSGPTLMSPLISSTAAMVREKTALCYQDEQQYTILLIITDGVINDLEKTKLAIIDASTLPMSIIIIGVGAADFGPMVELDSDNQLLEQDGQRAERDIVQFVHFDEVITEGPNALEEAVLSEIPGQFLLYMKQHGITPGAPLSGGEGGGPDDENDPSDPTTPKAWMVAAGKAKTASSRVTTASSAATSTDAAAVATATSTAVADENITETKAGGDL